MILQLHHNYCCKITTSDKLIKAWQKISSSWKVTNENGLAHVLPLA